MLNLGLVGDLLRPALSRVEHVQLVKLVAVPVGSDDDRVVPRRGGDLAHRLLRERRQLVRPAAVDRNAPEVELAGHVAHEEHVRAVACEREAGPEAAVGDEALEGGQLRRRAHCCHAAETIY